ncbi:MAG: NAD+ synthase [Acidobacteriota bacterium]
MTHGGEPAVAARGSRTDAAARLRIAPDLTRRILVRFLRDGLHRHGFMHGVLGLSGGLDSSLVAYLTAEALGPEHVTGVALPYAASDPTSLRDAAAVAKATGIRLETVPITDMAAACLSAVPPEARVRRGNILARLRMLTLFDLSARDQALVIGTSNKTELLLGYSTTHGDSACALMPIGDLYKTQVWQLARHVGVPDDIRSRAPSADLWPGQTDEEEMGFTYAAVDRLLVRMVDDRLHPDQLLAEGFDPALIRTVRDRIRRSHYKRRLPPVAKVSTRTVGIDFRYPRDWDAWGRD